MGPYQNFHESQKFGPRKIFKLAQCLPLAAWRLRTLGPQQTERGTGGTNGRGLQVHQEGERLEDGQLSLKHQHRRSRRSLASAFLLGSLPCPPAPRRLAVPASFAFSRLTCWILV